MTFPLRSPRRTRGFSLVELMVALALGLLLTIAMGAVYITGKSSFSRQQQLSSLQQNVRIAFEYLGSDARMVGHMGCFTGSDTSSATIFSNNLGVGLATNYAYGVEGYEYTTGAYTLTANAPADINTAASWVVNTATNANAVNTVPVTTIAGAGNGLTPGSDVLAIRTAAGRPVRLAANANTGANQSAFTIETMAASTGKCSNGTTDKLSGFCASSHGLIASCTQARVFQVSTITAGASPAPSTLTLGASMGSDPEYLPGTAEVFPMQTIVYYVKQSLSNTTTTSLYRRIFDGDNAAGLEQELIEGVENLQLRYGVDTDATPDGIVNAYVNANAVSNWNTVVSVRMSLLMRTTTPVDTDTTVATGGVVNGVAITYPTTGSKYDRRVFTTTVAVRNKISYF
jgi:type IV pilus assembly protein PilW